MIEFSEYLYALPPPDLQISKIYPRNVHDKQMCPAVQLSSFPANLTPVLEMSAN